MVRGNIGWIFALTAIFSLVLIGCQAEKTADENLGGLDFSKLEIPSTYYYQMGDTAQVYGQMFQKLERIEEDGRDLVRATFRIYGGANGESKILFDPDDGSPVKMVSTQDVQDTKITSTSHFAEDHVLRVISAPVSDIQDTLITSISGMTYDWMQSTFLVQAMDLESMIGDTLQLQFYQGFGTAFVQPGFITVLGTKPVTVPAGEFDAYHVRIDYAGAGADLYIEQGGEQRMIKHDVPGRTGTVSTVLIPESEIETDG